MAQSGHYSPAIERFLVRTYSCFTYTMGSYSGTGLDNLLA